MQTITISLSVPDGTTVSIAGIEGVPAAPSTPTRDPVEEYWTEFLSPNGRKLYGAAARIEDLRGGAFTFEDIASNLSIDYESAKSYHRNSGRTAARWEREKGTAAPIKLEFDGNYGPQEGAAGWRSRYELPPGVAAKIISFPPVSPRPGETP